MIGNKFGRKKKAPNNEGRATKVTSIMISSELKKRLAELKDAYEATYDETVTYDQMLDRWAAQVRRFDPKVIATLEVMKEKRREVQEKQAAGLGITPEQLEANREAFDPADPANEPWNLRYFFEKDGEQLEARLEGLDFYAELNGQKVRSLKMICNGWNLLNDAGIEIDAFEVSDICRLIQERSQLAEIERSRQEIEEGKGIEVDINAL